MNCMRLSTKWRIVVDTNVFISGALFNGEPGIVLDVILRRKVDLLISAELEAEILLVFSRFETPQPIKNKIQDILEHHVIKIVPKKISSISRDPKDDMLLALSLAGNADYLITGDKDLLVLRRFEKTKIVTPRQFIKDMTRRNIF